MTSKTDSAAPSLVERLARLSRSPDAPLVALCIWLIVLGWFLRLHAFDFPARFLFDEHHFIENARKYLGGGVDRNDHPPLGKLWLALSMYRFGDGPVGWRFPSLVFGVISVGVGAITAFRLFKTRTAALLAAAFLSIDGFLISYSRAGLLDGNLAAAAVVSVFAATLSPLGLGLIGGLGAGLAMATKFSGIAALVPPLVALFLRDFSARQKITSLALCIGLSTSIYVLCFLIGLSLVHREATLINVFSETKRLIEHHAALTDMKNPATSSWPTWLMPVRPLMLARVSEDGMVRALSSLGNVALWWSACSLFLLSLACCSWKGLASFLSTQGTQKNTAFSGEWRDIEEFLYSEPKAILLLISGALAFLAPWVLTHRDSYIYHFLPSYSLLLLLLSGFVAKIGAATRAHSLTFLAVVAIVAGIYAPLWSFIPISESGLRQRLFLGSWR